MTPWDIFSVADQPVNYIL